MTIWIEIGGRIWLVPQFRKHDEMYRVFWLFFGFGFLPNHFGSWLAKYTKHAVEYGEQKRRE